MRTNARVVGIDHAGVTLAPEGGAPGESIPSRTVLWAAGVAASPLAKSLGAPLDRAGRVLVEPDLTVPGHPEIFVIGDMAAVKQDDGFVPGVAPAAIQEAKHTAENIARSLAGRRERRFATTTRARSRRSAAPRGSPTSGGSSSRASSRGWPGCSSTSSS